MKVLVVEDDAAIREGLLEILGEEGYQAIPARDGNQALELFAAESPDFICLDIMMPGKSGYDVCREIRRKDDRVPIIFISAKSEEIDKVIGLELGADDYITKPFGIREVVARIRAVSRRCLQGQAADPEESFQLSDLRVYPAQLRARRGDTPIDLSIREVKILELFHDNPGVVLDRDRIFNACWGENYFPASRALDQCISQLRKRIEQDPAHPRIITTVHGAGYRYDLAG